MTGRRVAGGTKNIFRRSPAQHLWPVDTLRQNQATGTRDLDHRPAPLRLRFRKEAVHRYQALGDRRRGSESIPPFASFCRIVEEPTPRGGPWTQRPVGEPGLHRMLGQDLTGKSEAVVTPEVTPPESRMSRPQSFRSSCPDNRVQWKSIESPVI